MSVLKLISENPFRILGVYSNARPSEVISNCDEMEAYLSIGQSIQFDTDFNKILPEVTRTKELVEQAKRQINLPIDKLKYALFWFYKDSSSAHGTKYLNEGDFDNARSIFEIDDSFATLLNIAVLSFINSDYATAIAKISELVHDKENGYCNDFVSSICGQSTRISEDELAHLFIDSLLEEVDAQKLADLFHENGKSYDDEQYLLKKVINEPITHISAEVTKAKSVQRTDAKKNYNAGLRLIQNTEKDIKKLKSLLEANSMQYQLVADELAETILQCGINYYNNSNDYEDVEVDNALELQEYAYKIAVGRMAKDRCKQNVDILKKKKEEQPPKEIRGYDKTIKEKILTYKKTNKRISDAIELIKSCAPQLIAIKEIIGKNNKYYFNISTLIVDAALNTVIEEVNMFLNINDPFIRSIRGFSSVIISTVEDAWRATLYMDKLDIDYDYKMNRYMPNKKILKGIVDKLSISTYSISANLDMRTESEFFESCKYKSDYQEYLKKYPNGKFVEKAKQCISEKKIEKPKKKQSALNHIWVKILAILFVELIYVLIGLIIDDVEGALGFSLLGWILGINGLVMLLFENLIDKIRGYK